MKVISLDQTLHSQGKAPAPVLADESLSPQIREAYQLARMLVENETLFDVHLIQEKNDVLLSLFTLVMLVSRVESLHGHARLWSCKLRCD